MTPTKYEDVKQLFTGAQQARERAAQEVYAERQRLILLDNHHALRVTLPSGVRVHVSNVVGVPNIQISKEDFFGQKDKLLTEADVNKFSTADLLVLHQIRSAIDLWQNGSSSELTRPDAPFGRWPNVNFLYDAEKK